MEREPTSHERRAGASWEASYADGPAPWDIGRPQPAIVRVASSFTGPVLDAGCGTGENALHLASLGLSVFGFDVAETAVRRAREQAAARGLDAEFAVADALRLDALGRTFETTLDCGLFHTFDGGERRAYVASLAAVTKRLHVLCFRDAENAGPHPVREDELREAFAGWSVVAIVPEVLETRFGVMPAWLASFSVLGA
jgi:SAM-dependent methyltransferase